MHSEYLSDQQKIRQEILQQFKDELDATRSELEAKSDLINLAVKFRELI